MIKIDKNFNDRIPSKLLYIIMALEAEGMATYIVGGAVRDWLQNKSPKDYDIEVFAESYDALEKLLSSFSKPAVDDKKFGVIRLKVVGCQEAVEFTLPRNDNKVGSKHNTIEVEFEGDNKPRTVLEASRRRDFTINAIYYRPFEQHIIDCWGGVADLDNKVLRVVDENTFDEDPLRIWRILPAIAKNNIKQCVLPNISFGDLDLNVMSEARWGELSKALSVSNLTSVSANQFLYIFKKLTGLECRHHDVMFTNLQDYFCGEKLIATRVFVLLYKSMKCSSLDIFSGCSDSDRLPIKKLESYFGIPKFILRLVNRLSDGLSIIQFGLEIACKNAYPDFTPREIIDFRCSVYYYNNEKRRNLLKVVIEEGWYEHHIVPIVTGKFLIDNNFRPSPRFSFIIDYMYKQQLLRRFSDEESATKYLNENREWFLTTDMTFRWVDYDV